MKLMAAAIRILIVAGVLAVSVPETARRDNRPANPWHLLNEARRMKARGQYASQIVQICDMTLFRGYDSLHDLSDTVVLATALTRESRLSPNGMSIETLNVFHLDEVLSGIEPVRPQSREQRIHLPGVTSLRINPRTDLIVWTGGGQLDIDEVFFSEGSVTTPRFWTGRRYILFLKSLSIDLSHYQESYRRRWDLNWQADGFPFWTSVDGRYGCLGIEGSGLVKTMTRRQEAVSALEEQFDSRLDEFVRYFRNRERRDR